MVNVSYGSHSDEEGRAFVSPSRSLSQTTATSRRVALGAALALLGAAAATAAYVALVKPPSESTEPSTMQLLASALTTESLAALAEDRASLTFDTLDLDGDGVVAKNEYLKRLAQHRDDVLARLQQSNLSDDVKQPVATMLRANFDNEAACVGRVFDMSGDRVVDRATFAFVHPLIGSLCKPASSGSTSVPLETSPQVDTGGDVVPPSEPSGPSIDGGLPSDSVSIDGGVSSDTVDIDGDLPVPEHTPITTFDDDIGVPSSGTPSSDEGSLADERGVSGPSVGDDDTEPSDDTTSSMDNSDVTPSSTSETGEDDEPSTDGPVTSNDDDDAATADDTTTSPPGDTTTAEDEDDVLGTGDGDDAAPSDNETPTTSPDEGTTRDNDEAPTTAPVSDTTSDDVDTSASTATDSTIDEPTTRADDVKNVTADETPTSTTSEGDDDEQVTPSPDGDTPTGGADVESEAGENNAVEPSPPSVSPDDERDVVEDATATPTVTPSFMEPNTPVAKVLSELQNVASDVSLPGDGTVNATTGGVVVQDPVVVKKFLNELKPEENVDDENAPEHKSPERIQFESELTKVFADQLTDRTQRLQFANVLVKKNAFVVDLIQQCITHAGRQFQFNAAFSHDDAVEWIKTKCLAFPDPFNRKNN